MRRRQSKNTKNKSNAGQEKALVMQVKESNELMKYLIESMPKKSRNAIKSILARGQVSVNDRETTQFDQPLQIGDRVTIEWNKLTEEEKPIGLQILYEDEDIIVIHKDSGMLSITAGKETEVTAHRQLMDYVRRSEPKNRVFIVHRLDRDTSGVMVFAKTQEAKQTLQEGWHEITHERTYIALVEKQIKKPEGTITSWLKESKTLFMYSSPTPNGGQKAITHYKVLKSTHDYSL